MLRLPETAGILGDVPRVSADSGMGAGLASAAGASWWNRDICKRDKESAMELLVPTM